MGSSFLRFVNMRGQIGRGQPDHASLIQRVQIDIH